MKPPYLRRDLTACTFLIAMTWLVFGQTLGLDFVNYDDHVYVYDNLQVRGGLTLRGIAPAFTDTHTGNWHPPPTEDIFTSAEPGSILLATGDAIVFPVTYLQTVEGLGRQGTLISLPMFSQPWYVHQLRERYSDLVIPFEYCDARSNNLKLLVDANASRTACFVVIVGNDDHSLDSSYWPYQRGLQIDPEFSQAREALARLEY